MKYKRPGKNEWVQPKPHGYKFCCCDCGLVHRMNFRVVKICAVLKCKTTEWEATHGHDKYGVAEWLRAPLVKGEA